MESPVMTSASSHRLRSAVSACAQPTHTYLSASYLSSIRRETHRSESCLKKTSRSGNNDSPLEKFNVVRKSQQNSLDCPVLYKKHKANGKNCFDHFCESKSHQKSKNNSFVDSASNAIPKRQAIGKVFLPELKINGNLSDLKHPRHFSREDNSCKKEIDVPNSIVSTDKNDFLTSDNKGEHKILNDRDGNRKEDKRGNSRKGHDVPESSKDRSAPERARSDECPERGAAYLGEGHGNERREISKWQPEHPVTRRTAQIVREIQNVWQTRVGCSKAVPTENVQLLFSDLQLYPNATQVSKMLKCARECPESSTSNFVTFGDFYKIASDLLKLDKNFRNTQALSVPCVDRDAERHEKKVSRGMSKYEVFLGGSCNPTTWRTDIAIPELETMGISYYNPQVEDWRPDLLEAEYHAKENATVMFFVIDNQTRGVSALIEVAHLAGNRRKLILVIQSYAQENQIICDEEISQTEYEDLKAGQRVLRQLVEHEGIPVFDNIKVALQRTEKVLRENLTVHDLQGPVRVIGNSLDFRELFFKFDPKGSGKVTLADVLLAGKMIVGSEISLADSERLLANSGWELNGTNPDDVLVEFGAFFELLTQFQTHQKGHKHLGGCSGSDSFVFIKDVYLGGTVENTSWRESIAIPALKSHNLTYFVPKTEQEKETFTEVEAAAMDHSRILVFVITSTSRSIASMAIAGHYIGKGAKVVLCVQHLPEGAIIANEKLSDSAIKDYNRARMYLTDIAKRNKIPVFEEISKVVEHIIRELGPR